MREAVGAWASSAQDGLVAGALTAELGAAASATLVLAAAARPWRGREASMASWGAPLALTAGTAVGFVLTRGVPALPPKQALHWAFYFLLAAGALGWIESRAPRLARGLGLLLVLLQTWFLLGFQRERYWGRTEGLAWSAGLALTLFLSWRALARRTEARAAPAEFGLAFALALAAGAYGLGGGALFAQLAGALALCAGLCALLGAWRRAPGLGAGGAAPLSFVHASLVWLAHWLYELSTPSFVLLALVPFAPLVGALIPAFRPRARAVATFLAPLVVAAAALAVELAAADTSAYG